MAIDPGTFTHLGQFEQLIKTKVSSSRLVYLKSGADTEVTVERNRTDFKNYSIHPRMLRGIGEADTKTTILGSSADMPICVAPTGYQRLYHHDGEVANAKATASMNTIWTMSTFANHSIPEIAEAVPGSVKWQQVYVFKDRSVTEHIVKRAAEHGFQALALTVDAPIPGRRRANITDPVYLPEYYSLPNLEGGQRKTMGMELVRGTGAIFSTVDWSMIKWLKQVSGLPVVVKGIMTPEDAELAIQYGADAIWVSNHGGRQIDYEASTISVLKDITAAVSGRRQVYVDGGFTTGTQVFMALAMGATAVFVGRPVIWGLACAGESGVRKVLEILHTELKTTMQLAGCKDLASIDPAMVRLRHMVSRI